jgi:hypothetical protein
LDVGRVLLILKVCFFGLCRNTLELLSNREQEDRRTTLQTEALKHQETAMENGAVNASGISLAHLRRGQEFDIVFHNLSGLVS